MATLHEYYASHGIDLATVLDQKTPWRFIRLNPRCDGRLTLQHLETEIRSSLKDLKHGERNFFYDNERDDDPPLNAQSHPSNSPLEGKNRRMMIRPIEWLNPAFHFYAVPSVFKLSQSPCFQEGLIYGQDISSGAAVAALLTSQLDYVQESDDFIHTARATDEMIRHSNIAKKQYWPISDSVFSSHNSQSQGTIRILDLCCCPGLKLCAIADYLNQNMSSLLTKSSSSPYSPLSRIEIVGVDVSSSRLALCKKVVHKYQIALAQDSVSNDTSTVPSIHVQLYCGDGTMLGKSGSSSGDAYHPRLVFDSYVAKDQFGHQNGKRKRANKSARAREERLIQDVVRSQREEKYDAFAQNSFDCVLVDAECSTDGSIKHLLQRAKKSRTDGTILDSVDQSPPDWVENTMLTDPVRCAQLHNLQRQLAAAGFSLLKPGGSMVYSTCSMSIHQNEEIVKWLLFEQPQSQLVPVNIHCIHELSRNKLIAKELDHITPTCTWPSNNIGAREILPGTMQFITSLHDQRSSRFDWYVDEPTGEGFFLAKIKKRPIHHSIESM